LFLAIARHLKTLLSVRYIVARQQARLNKISQIMLISHVDAQQGPYLE